MIRDVTYVFPMVCITDRPNQEVIVSFDLVFVPVERRNAALTRIGHEYFPKACGRVAMPPSQGVSLCDAFHCTVEEHILPTLADDVLRLG